MGVSNICANYDKRISMPFYISDRIIVLFCSFIVYESTSSSLRIIVAFTGFMKMSMRTIASCHSLFNGSLFSAIAACFFCDIIIFIVNKIIASVACIYSKYQWYTAAVDTYWLHALTSSTNDVPPICLRTLLAL